MEKANEPFEEDRIVCGEWKRKSNVDQTGEWPILTNGTYENVGLRFDHEFLEYNRKEMAYRFAVGKDSYYIKIKPSMAI
jgi:hypothetical protein